MAEEREGGTPGRRDPLEGVPGAEAAAERLVGQALAEDVGEGDRTTDWSVPAGAWGEAVIVSREEGVVAGGEFPGRVFRRLSGAIEVESRLEDGDAVEPGEPLCRVRGEMAPILTGERAALNFLSHLSGVATLTRRFVRAVRHTGCRITDTRKTTPGWRVLEKAATRAGGAVNHRMGLYDMVLLKENHVRAAGGVRPALEAVMGRADAAGLRVEVEVESTEQLEEVLEGSGGRPDRILLDNMSRAELREAVEAARRDGSPRPELEASGGVTLENAAGVAETGVDLISVGRLTHSAPALDLSLLVQGTEGA